MSREIAELQQVLTAIIAEQRRLSSELDVHHAAMKALDLTQMDSSATRQTALRLRVASLDNRRRSITTTLGRLNRFDREPTLSQLASALGESGRGLLTLRDELRNVADEISRKTFVSSRVAGAVLGHLNTVVRLVASAVKQGGVYGRNGSPSVAARIGVIEAVG